MELGWDLNPITDTLVRSGEDIDRGEIREKVERSRSSTPRSHSGHQKAEEAMEDLPVDLSGEGMPVNT